MTNVVPDIYQRAKMDDGWISLATDLKKGEKVRLITKAGPGLHEVLEVKKGAFRTDFRTDEEVIFVYGREVADFRVVDYEAISMLNVSATQEIFRRLQAEVAAQDKRLAELEARDQARDARLIALEKRLRLLDESTNRTASLKLGAE
jgi:hypothetical protein